MSKWVDWPSIISTFILTFLGFKISFSMDPHGFLLGFYTILAIPVALALFVRAIFKKEHKLKLGLYIMIIILVLGLTRYNWSKTQKDLNYKSKEI